MKSTGESDVAGDTDDAGLAADVLEDTIGGSWKNLSAIAAKELHFVLRRLVPHFSLLLSTAQNRKKKGE